MNQWFRCFLTKFGVDSTMKYAQESRKDLGSNLIKNSIKYVRFGIQAFEFEYDSTLSCRSIASLASGSFIPSMSHLSRSAGTSDREAHRLTEFGFLYLRYPFRFILLISQTYSAATQVHCDMCFNHIITGCYVDRMDVSGFNLKPH
eukprot:150933_1